MQNLKNTNGPTHEVFATVRQKNLETISKIYSNFSRTTDRKHRLCAVLVVFRFDNELILSISSKCIPVAKHQRQCSMWQSISKVFPFLIFTILYKRNIGCDRQKINKTKNETLQLLVCREMSQRGYNIVIKR